MQPDEDDATQLLREGRYYDEARRWYSTLYIGPISERSQFLLLGIVAGLVGLTAFFAVMGLLPLADKPGLIVMNPRVDLTEASLSRLRFGKGNVNDALREYMVIQYVVSRESYVPEDVQRNSLFVAAHSDETTLAQYAAIVGPENPRNPSAMLGQAGKRLVTINSVNISNRGDVPTATVRFSTEIVSVTTISKTQWTATLQFNYSDAVASEVTDPDTGEKQANLQEPSFQVVNYALSQTP